MTLSVAKFTPEVMLSATRRSAAVPNSTGTKALFSTTAYSFAEHKKTMQLRVLDIGTGSTSCWIEDQNCSGPVWLEDERFLYVKSGSKGQTSLLLGDVNRVGQEVQTVATFDGGISGVKVTKLANGTVGFACVALARPDGKLANPDTDKQPLSSAKTYTSLFARHWDSWISDQRNSIWYGALEKESGGTYRLVGNDIVNALAGTKLESPVPPFGGTADFDIGPSGLVFVAKDADLDPANYTKTDLYHVALKTFTETSPPAPRPVATPGLEGYSNAPTFSHDGANVAFTRMRSSQYESDKPRLLLVPNIADEAATAHEFFATDDAKGGWDRRPESIVWSADDKTLFVTAEEEARVRLWTLPAHPATTELPAPIDTGDGSVSDVQLLAAAAAPSSCTDHPSSLLVTTSSLVDNSCYSVVQLDHGGEAQCRVVSSNSRRGRAFGLSSKQCHEIWFQGAGDYQCQALVLKPSTFSPTKRYPLAFLIHGGPQGAWMHSWSTRWNPAVFAEQGYVVVAPNPTGSTGYGMRLQDAITGNWGGRPYQDLVKCFEYVVDKMPYVDADRAVALGASYGGYMINWIQGHPLGRKFKALVCHDGVFSTLNQFASEELFFPVHDFEGPIWENRACYEKWDPSRFIDQWATPQLIIHGELDYRLPITEGLAPFNILQSRGIPSKLLVFPDENHWVLKPENSLVWHRTVLHWINKYSGIDKQHHHVEGTAAKTAAMSISS